jgi:hypothetical protein
MRDVGRCRSCLGTAHIAPGADAGDEGGVSASGAGGGHGLAEALGEPMSIASCLTRVTAVAKRAFRGDVLAGPTSPSPWRGRRPAEGLVVDRWASAALVMPFLLASAGGQRLRMTFMALVWAALEKVS